MPDNLVMERELVAGLIIRGARLLMVKNVKHGTVRLEPPGGKVERGEEREAALVREIAEEVGLVVRELKPFGTFKTGSPEGTFNVVTYICSVEEGEPRIIEPEKIPEFGWYTLDELREKAESGLLVPNMVAALEKLQEHLR